jgi:hypothetical protein
MARPFNNNMFQDGFAYEDFDRTGIMDPGMADVIEMRKEANAARDGATNQYEADVADFKNTLATEAEQGIASLPEATNNQFTNNSFANKKFPIGADGEPVFFGAEDIDYTGIPGNPINTGNNYPSVPVVAPTTNPYQNVFIPGEPEPVYDPYLALDPEEIYTPYTPPGETYTPYTPPGEPEPVYDPYVEPVLPDLGVVDPYTFYEPTPAPYTDPYDQGDNYVTDDAVYNPNDPVSDYPFVDPETGGDYVLVIGDPTNPGPGVVVTDPVTGELPPGYISGGVDGPAGTIPPEVFVPAPTPAPVINYYTGKPVQNPYQVFEQPTTTSNYTRPMSAADFGSSPGITTATTPSATYTGLNSTNYNPPTDIQLAASLAPFLPPADDTATTPPGMNQGGRVPMGNNNQLNSGLSRLPINQQNDTLTQVFQSGFRPRR